MLKGAIFDMDGLLLDTERLCALAWTEVAVEAGKDREEAPVFHRSVCGTSGQHTLDIIRQCYPDLDPADFLQRCLARVAELLAEEVPPKPGMWEILRFFKEHEVKMAVASGSSLEAIKSNFARLGALDYFDALVSGYEVEHGKPAPDVFLLAAERLGLAPEECYVFEDSPNGVRAGVAAGCKTIMIPDLMPATEELSQLTSGIYPSLHEAVEAIVKDEI